MAEVVVRDQGGALLVDASRLRGSAQQGAAVVLAEEKARFRAHAVERGAGLKGERQLAAEAGLVGLVPDQQRGTALVVVVRGAELRQRPGAQRGLPGHD